MELGLSESEELKTINKFGDHKRRDKCVDDGEGRSSREGFDERTYLRRSDDKRFTKVSKVIVGREIM